MAYTATNLITDALNLSGVVSRKFQTPDGDDIQTGLSRLNDILAVKSIDNRLIPFFSTVEINLIPGTEKYFIPGLMLVDTVTFNIGNVRFKTEEVGRRRYFGDTRVDGINSLPFTWTSNRSLNGTDIYLYFFPNSNYVLKIWGKFALGNVTLAQDLSLTLEQNYTTYLQFALANYLCMYYGLDFGPDKLRELKSLQREVMDIQAIDFNLQKSSTLGGGRGGDIWVEANLKLGWDAS
jgi:hypothetical protein